MNSILKTKYGIIALLFIFWGCSSVFFDAFYDTDKDTVPNTSDNCKYTPNQDQSDGDLDGQGDVCDGDLSNGPDIPDKPGRLPDLVDTTVYLQSGNRTIDVETVGDDSGPVDSCTITAGLSVSPAISVSADGNTCVLSIPDSLPAVSSMYQVTILASNGFGEDDTPALVTFYILNPPDLQDGVNVNFIRTIPGAEDFVNSDTTGNIISCTSNVPLPAGLMLSASPNAETCIIFGTPTEKTTGTLLAMVTARNAAGSTQTVAVNIDVADPDVGYSISIDLDGVTFSMKYVPAKTFPTGSADTGSATLSQSYYIMETETTSQLWQKVIAWAKNNSYTFDEHADYLAAPANSKIPVITHWYNAIKFANALTEYYNFLNPQSQLTLAYGGTTEEQRKIREDDLRSSIIAVSITDNTNASGFRLPSNHEWELAARFIEDSNNDGDISDSGEYYPGDYASGATANTSDATETQKVAWYSANSVAGTPKVVKGKTANALGLYDMSGNVKEWVFDTVSGNLGQRQLRGGSVESAAALIRVSRNSNDYEGPGSNVVSARNSTGIRLVSRR